MLYILYLEIPIIFLFQLSEMPCEFVTNFDPRYPVVLGGLLSSEDTMGFLQVSV